MKGLTMESPMELAISTLGNLCLAGSTLSYFQLQNLGVKRGPSSDHHFCTLGILCRDKQ